MGVTRLELRTVVVTTPTAGTAVPITTDKTYTHKFEVHIPNGNTGASNFIGDSSVDNTSIPRAKATAAGNPDGTYTFVSSEESSLSGGDPFDLSKVFIDVTTGGDTAIVQFLAATSAD